MLFLAVRLMSEQGLSLLMQQGKRLKIRHKYTSQAEKNANVVSWKALGFDTLKRE